MYTFFKKLKEMADLDDTAINNDILSITKELALGAGYNRVESKFKNGRSHIVTTYTKKFDDVLTAKWLLYYKNIFMGKLSKHGELSEFYTQIIFDTFNMFMSHLDLDKVSNDLTISRYVNMTLLNRIGYALYIKGSVTRLHTKNKYNKTKARYKSFLDYNSLPLDIAADCSVPKSIDLSDDCLVDLTKELCNNIVGDRVLYALLYSNRKVQLNKIDNFIPLASDEYTQDTKKYIADAYNIIKNYISSIYNIEKKNITIKDIKFSYEA